MEIRGSIVSELEIYTPTNVGRNEAPNVAQDSEEISKIDLDKAINTLNSKLKYEDCYAEYKVHDKLGDIMIKIVNSKTKEVLLEIPPKKILDMVAKLLENGGVILDKKI